MSHGAGREREGGRGGRAGREQAGTEFFNPSGADVSDQPKTKGLRALKNHIGFYLKCRFLGPAPKDSDSEGQVPESVMGPIFTETSERVKKHRREQSKAVSLIQGNQNPRLRTSLVLYCHQLNTTHNLDGVRK